MNSAHLYEKDVVWDRGGEPAQAGRPQWLFPAVGASAVGILLAAFLLGRLYQPCNSMPQETRQIEAVQAQGQWSTVIGLAEMALAQQNPTPCPGVTQAIATVWYGASMKQLFAMPLPAGMEDTVGQQLAVKWLTIEQQAKSYGVQTDPPMSVAADAYNRGIWALGDAAFKRALENGDITANSPQVAAFHYAMLRNRGHQMAFNLNQQLQQQGVLLLATAQAIAQVYHLPNGEACSDLQQLGFHDCNQPSPDWSDPVLAAKYSAQ